MNSHEAKNKINNNQPIAQEVSQLQSNGKNYYNITDNRKENITQFKIAELANESNNVTQLKYFQSAINSSSYTKNTIQLKEIISSKLDVIQKKGNTTGMPDNLKAGIENLSGYSMDDVKVHYNSDKPAQLQAHAYAQGTDIHLASGQEKHLPHEAWHVVQQKQGRVSPTKKLKGAVNINDNSSLEKEADYMGEKALLGKWENKNLVDNKNNSNTVQLVKKKGVVYGISHMVEMVDGSLFIEDYLSNESLEIKDGDILELAENNQIYSRRGPNQENYNTEDQIGDQKYAWQKVIKLNGEILKDNIYAREDAFHMINDNSSSAIEMASEFFESTATAPAAFIGNDGISGMADVLNNKTANTNSGEAAEVGSEAEFHSTYMSNTADTITGVSGILGLAKAFKDLGDPKKQSKSDLFLTAMTLEENAMKTGESISKLTNAYTEGGNDTAKTFGSTFEGFSAAFGTIKSGFQTMKNLLETIKEFKESNTREGIINSAKTFEALLSTAKSVMLSVKSFHEATAGSASGELMASIPGLDIGVSAVKLIMHSYYCIESGHYASQMKVKLTTIQENENKSGQKLNLETESENIRKSDALQANQKEVLVDTIKRQRSLENRGKPYEKLSEKEREKERSKLSNRRNMLEENVLAEKEDISGIISEYSLVKELKDANVKRVKRQSIHIATDMANIAGAVATLSVVGAAGGAVTKGAAAAVETALPAARLAKQAARDRAARKEAKGKSNGGVMGLVGKVAAGGSPDTSKSTAAKAAWREKQAISLFNMIRDIHGKDSVNDKAEIEKVKLYVRASGVNYKKLINSKSAQDGYIMIYKAISAREL